MINYSNGKNLNENTNCPRLEWKPGTYNKCDAYTATVTVNYKEMRFTVWGDVDDYWFNTEVEFGEIKKNDLFFCADWGHLEDGKQKCERLLKAICAVSEYLKITEAIVLAVAHKQKWSINYAVVRGRIPFAF